MGVQLPSEPITRKEQYLAKAAGQAVEIPAEPITREEAYLDAIAKGSGGGGGTSDYPQLTNKPQINGTTLVGNKTASQLGLASTADLAGKVDKVDGKDLSSNDYSDTEKQKNADNATAISAIKDGQSIDSFADVETALDRKQDVLLYGGANPSTGADGDMYVKLVRDESTLIDMFGSPSAESTDDYEMSYTVDSSVMGDYYDYEAFGTGKGFGQNGRGSTTITYHFKNSKFKPVNVSYCNNFSLSGGGYLESADFTIKASNDGTNWDTLYSTSSSCPRDTSVSADITTNTYYSYFKFEMNSGGGYTGIRNIVMNGISESYTNIDNIYFRNDCTWLKDAFVKKSDLDDVPTANSNNPVKSGGVKSAIDAAVASAYHHAGTKTCAELVAGLLVAGNEGNVYNMTDSGTTTADFIEGQGQPIKAGDNVGIAKISDGVYKFDLLSGFVDTTNFVQKSETAGLLKNDGTVDTTIQGDVGTLKSGFTNLDNEVNGDATTYPYADVITIPDAVPANLAECSVKIEPVQDLHGYDHPWVGGAGVNQYVGSPDCDDYTNIALWTKETATYNGNPVYSKSSSWDGLYKEISLPVGVHTFSFMCKGDETATNGGKVYLATNSTTAVVNTNEFTFTRTAEWQKFSFSFEVTQAGTVAPRVESMGPAKIYISEYQLEAGSTATTYAPYTNICPITGHTEASVQRDGRNRCDNSTNIIGFYGHDGVYSASSDYKTSALIPVSPNTSYTASVFDTTTNQRVNGLVYTEWDAYGNFIGQTASSVTSITTTANTKFIRVRNYNADTTLINSNHYAYQVELGSSATDYEPFKGKTYTIALGDTIYGGTVDFDSGVMTVTHKLVDLSTLSWYVSGAYEQAYLSDAKALESDDVAANALCEKYHIVARTATDNTGDAAIDTQKYLKIRISESPTGNICYELATPTTIQLTPQQIQLLKGTNTLTASTGQISVTVNGVSGSIGAVQEQVNELAEDVAELQGSIFENWTEVASGYPTDRPFLMAVMHTVPNNGVYDSKLFLTNPLGRTVYFNLGSETGKSYLNGQGAYTTNEIPQDYVIKVYAKA